jgi:N-acetylglucosamine kinase-like BadF-type ATPase
MKSSGLSVVEIEGGATQETVFWGDSDGSVLRDFSLGPANALLLTGAELVDLFREVKQGIGDQLPDAVCVGLAGVRGEKEALRFRSAMPVRH